MRGGKIKQKLESEDTRAEATARSLENKISRFFLLPENKININKRASQCNNINLFLWEPLQRRYPRDAKILLFSLLCV